jgi:hypothetical protein
VRTGGVEHNLSCNLAVAIEGELKSIKCAVMYCKVCRLATGL